MRFLNGVALAAASVVVGACASPSPTVMQTPAPVLRTFGLATVAPVTPPRPSANGLRAGVMATVVAGELAQVADPNRPREQAFQSPLHPGERALRTLGELAHVMIVGGPTNPNGDVYWQVADDPFPGCCAPFGWVRESQSSTAPAIATLNVACPDPSVPMNGNQLLGLGLMEAATCFGSADFHLRGEVRCAQPLVNQFVSITGPDWTSEPTLCDVDQAVALYGPAVTGLFAAAKAGLFDAQEDLVAHLNDQSSDACRWGPGNDDPISVANAPDNTAQFACRMSVYVTSATPST